MTSPYSGLIGLKVKLTFNTETWPIHHATYTYDGADETGYWVIRKDGVQRHFEYGDVVQIELAEEEVDEQRY